MNIIFQILICIISGLSVVFNGLFAVLPFCLELRDVINNIKEYFIAEILGVSPEFIHAVFILLSIVAIISTVSKLINKLRKTI